MEETKTITVRATYYGCEVRNNRMYIKGFKTFKNGIAFAKELNRKNNTVKDIVIIDKNNKYIIKGVETV